MLSATELQSGLTHTGQTAACRPESRGPLCDCSKSVITHHLGFGRSNGASDRVTDCPVGQMYSWHQKVKPLQIVENWKHSWQGKSLSDHLPACLSDGWCGCSSRLVVQLVVEGGALSDWPLRTQLGGWAGQQLLLSAVVALGGSAASSHQADILGTLRLLLVHRLPGHPGPQQVISATEGSRAHCFAPNRSNAQTMGVAMHRPLESITPSVA